MLLGRHSEGLARVQEQVLNVRQVPASGGSDAVLDRVQHFHVELLKLQCTTATTTATSSNNTGLMSMEVKRM